MRTKFSKLLSILLCLVMALTLLPTVALAAGSGYQDTDGHWAETAIDRWSAYGVLEGDSGNFNPDGALTRAQMAAILSRLLNLPDAPDAGFSDVKPDDWFAEYINKCAAAGIMLGDNGKANPNEPITRQQAIVMIARALGIQPIENPDLTKYADAAQVSAYAQGYVAALIEAGIVGGVTADLLAPQANINRASTVTIFDRAIGTYANEAGETVKADGNGLTLIVAKDVKLIDVPEGARIVVADGATGLTVNGKAVSDDQTYIVPETTTDTPSGGSSSGGSSSGGGHSHRYTYTDNGDGTHTGKCSANDSTLAPTAHTYTGGKCTACGAEAENKTASAKNTEGVIHYYDNLTAAITAAGAGDTVYLLKDVNLSSTLSVSKDVTLDLNGHNIHGELVRAVHVTAGTLTLTGSGTISSNVANVASSVIRVGSKETGTAGLVVGKDVTISTATAYGITVFGDTTETVTINGTVTSTAPSNASYDGCAVSTVGTDTTAATITINDGAVLSAANTNAIYMPSGNLTVNGGTITGLTGIYVKSGSTTITGGTITGNGEKKDYTAYGNGGISTGDALVVDSCGYPNGAPKVSVSGGSFTSTSAKAVASYQSGENDTVTKFISGGTFSTSLATYLATGYKSTKEGDIYVVSCKFEGGSGTEASPFLIATAEQFRNILSGTSSAPLYYKLTDNIDTSAIFDTYDYAVSSSLVEYIVLDGNGKTISGVNDGYLFNAIQNSTLKNLTVDLAAGESGISLNANYKMIYDHVNVTGESSVSGNSGAYTVYSFASDLTFNNCVANIDMSGTSYNAVFVGYVYTYRDKSVTPKLTFNSCENKGSLVCNYAAMFIGNPNAYNIVCNAVDCVNSGTIQATNTDTVLNYYYAVTSNCYGDFMVNGTVYKDIADGRSSAPTCAEDAVVTTTGQAIQGPLNTGMTLTQNADKTFTITDATIEGKTVDHYTVYVGVYAALKAGGSSRNYVTETISASAENKTTALKNLSFVDTQWVEEHSGAVQGKLAGNVTYTLNDETYYMLVTPETDTLNGKTKAPQMIYVVAYDASNKTLASATLFGNIA